MAVAKYGTAEEVALAKPNRQSRRYAVMIAGVSALALIALVAVSHSAHREVEMMSLKEGDKGQVDSVSRDNGSGTKSALPPSAGEFSKATLEGQKTAPVWHAQGATAPPAPPARALAIDYKSFFTGDHFAQLSDSCCKTVFFPPGHGELLPMDLELDGPYALRIRNFIGNRNTFLFNGGDEKTVAFINRYYGFDIKTVPVISGFKRRSSRMVVGDPSTPSAIPSAYALERTVGATYYGGLPDKVAPTEDMVAVDTLSLPGASIIIYNNWPRVPTGTPAFIARYCQIQDPYKEGGLPLKVEVTECPAAESRGFPCSCGFINFVGWNWLGSNANIWDTSVVNGDDIALTYSLGDAKGSKYNKKASMPHILHQVTEEVNVHEDCSGGNCHFV
jgi:hypothetical protein